jgi:ParB-like chromosome segregation protein Spo0J
MEALIEIDLITINKQPVVDDHVEDFVEILDSGRKVLPITVRRTRDGYVLVDGRHRLRAHVHLGRRHIRAWITP